VLPNAISHSDNLLFKTSEAIALMNGDACPIGSFVIARQTNTAGQTLLVRVNEILQAYKSVADLSGQADTILVQATDVSHENEHYHMPNIQMLQHWYLANPQVCEVLR
jgi:hypothetical protein